MALSLLHATQATGTDAGNGDIHKAEWNQEHAIVMATNKLLGRSTAGTGSVEEIAIGSGLSLSAGTLSASGGGGGSLTISNKTAAYTVVAGDLGTIINCTSGTFTVSLTAAATLGSGFNCWIWNTSSTATHAITIDPAGAETIDSTDTFTLRRGEGMQIVCNGTNWQTGDKKTMRAYAENLSVAGSDLYRPSASGTNSVAIGWRAVTSAGDSISLGSQATASGDVSTAVGGLTTASAAASTAIGLNSAYGGSKAVTGAGAMALGGSYASGTNSFAAAVANNTSSYGALGTGAVAIGETAKAASTYSIAIGALATASVSSSSAIGLRATADETDSVALGNWSRTIAKGKFAFASFQLGGAAGNTQAGKIILANSTTNATATVLVSTGSGSVTSTNQVLLSNNSAYAFSGTIIARQSAAGGTASAAWKVEGLIRREANAGTTTLVASTVTAISNVPGWTIALSADTTNGCLAITATGAAATNIRWVANIDTAELVYA